MHYFQGRNRWAIAFVFAIALLVVAFVIQGLSLEKVPMAPGPMPTQETIGGL